jgi:hypothetical protein
MKNFDLYLRRAIRQEDADPANDWTEHYMNYALLKAKIKAFVKRRRKVLRHLSADDTAVLLSSAAGRDDVHNVNHPEGYYWNMAPDNLWEADPDEAMRQLAQLERDEFVAAVAVELHKCGPFVAEQWRRLLQQGRQAEGNDSRSNAEDERDQLVLSEQLAKETLEVFHFTAVNILTLRQILLRYDAFHRTFQTGGSLQEWDLMRHESSTTTGDKSNTATNVAFLFDFLPLDELESILTRHLARRPPRHDDADALAQFAREAQHVRALLDSSLQSVERAAGGHIVMRDVISTKLRQFFLIGCARFGLSLEPRLLQCKGRHLKTEMKSLAKWRATKVLSPSAGGKDMDDDGDDDKYKLDPRNVWPLVLNLLSCFLFMMNNYIIEPSSAYYANALGSSDALSGMMVGAAPWFALVSAVAYSSWTNYSYKRPILFAGILMCVGNLLYATAYTYESMELCLLGRAITGLGAPRVINRRYVADATPFRLRTVASAAFAMATALGAALGPGMAIVLDAMTEFEFSLPLLGQQYFNGMTGPGYFMALSWGIYTLAILFTFGEPNRSGLDELRDREGSGEALSVALHTDETETYADEIEDEDDVDNDDALSVDQSLDLSKDSRSARSSATNQVSSNSPRYCIKHMTRSAALCMLIIFLKRIALEAIVGSTSIVTKNRYGWNITNVGTLHLINGIIVIPVSILAGWLSQFHQDRYLAMWLLAVTIFGMLFMVDFTDLADHDDDSVGYNDDLPLAVGAGRYIAGSLIAFSGIEACESFVASLMSKVVPSALAVGTFNSGLLATLVGTGGRATGDLFITLMALLSIRNLLNLLIIPGIVLMFVSMVLIRRNYAILAV